MGTGWVDHAFDHWNTTIVREKTAEHTHVPPSNIIPQRTKDKSDKFVNKSTYQG